MIVPYERCICGQSTMLGTHNFCSKYINRLIFPGYYLKGFTLWLANLVIKLGLKHLTEQPSLRIHCFCHKVEEKKIKQEPSIIGTRKVTFSFFVDVYVKQGLNEIQENDYLSSYLKKNKTSCKIDTYIPKYVYNGMHYLTTNLQYMYIVHT